MAQLPPPALLLDRREGGQHRPVRPRSWGSPTPRSAHRFTGSRRSLARSSFVARGAGSCSPTSVDVAFRYADEIFGLGREFLNAVKGHGSGRPIRLVVGITDVVPKLVVHQLLKPALGLDQPVQLVCREDRSLEGFLADLAVHAVDIVVADAPAGPGLPVRLHNHLVGESGTSFFASQRSAASLRKRFPMSLDGAPFLSPLAAARCCVARWNDGSSPKRYAHGSLLRSTTALSSRCSGRWVLAHSPVLRCWSKRCGSTTTCRSSGAWNRSASASMLCQRSAV